MFKNIKRLLYIILNILIICFIFYNSIKNGEESSNASRVVLNYINQFFEIIGTEINITGYFIRKMAHFVEFFALGLSITLLFNSFLELKIQILGYPLFLCTIIPVLDEYIQKFSIGRSSEVSDILIDFSGAFFGIILIFIISIIKNKITKDKKYRFYKGSYGFK